MMTIHMKGSIVAGTMMAAAILVSLPTCTHDPVGIEGIDSLCFSSTVLPVLQTSCGMAGCHESGTGNNGFDPAGYETVVQYVDPGNPKRSSLYKVITDISGENMMPPGQPLTKNQRMFIELWILQGAHGRSTRPRSRDA